MKIKSIIWLIVLGLAGYAGYGYLSKHFNQPALAYKRYVDALMTGDSSRVESLIAGKQAKDAFKAHEERMKRLGGEARLTFYDFLMRNDSADGNTVTLVVQHIVRVDPPGKDTYFGTEVRRDRHTVTLVKEQSMWKITSFEDSATAASQTTKLSQR